MKRRHRMPFGCAVEDGGVHFRLWAPSARTVDLCLEHDTEYAERPMTGSPDGWFELAAGDAGPGSRYRFRIDGGLAVPDPASRCNPDGVHGPSEVIDAAAFDWHDEAWRGRPWHEAAIYELHVGAFSPAGTFAGVAQRLDHLAELGVTALELMPVAAFPGRRNWGYDGVLPFAPASCYGRPDELKALVDAAHARGLMVLLDVVYNHFGPEGNYLHAYAAPFFTGRHRTPWGEAIDFDGPASRTVRDFFMHNALYWLEEFHLDGLRLDAVHAIADETRPHILVDIARAVRDGPGRARQVHLVLENDGNEARYLRPAHGAAPLYDAQWNDDLHHALHVLLTHEADGYYADYAAAPLQHLARCLAVGFAWQGEPSTYRGGARRGESSQDLAPTAFVGFLQNHDQVGNRAFGERIGALAAPQAVAAATALLLLAPSPPLLFMGEEFAAPQPFLYFCDFGPELAQAVTRGRRDEFVRFAGFSEAAMRSRIPDPGAEETFRGSCLDWHGLADDAAQQACLARSRELLDLRRREIVPRLPGMKPGAEACRCCGAHALVAHWLLGDGSQLALVANLGAAIATGITRPPGRVLHAAPAAAVMALAAGAMPAWSVVWLLDEAAGERP
ncbi:MAG: malto-oligosyltrehalose trehalohydrolase [Rhodocyclaceae bacterium]|nr:malto-oligosyltrehalose trehalohydrolase [Rhodocyclaceae bacterium]